MPPYGPQHPYSRKAGRAVKGAAALLWLIHPVIEAVFPTCCEGAASINSAPVLLRRMPQKLPDLDCQGLVTIFFRSEATTMEGPGVYMSGGIAWGPPGGRLS